jgi:hypothetical protein
LKVEDGDGDGVAPSRFGHAESSNSGSTAPARARLYRSTDYPAATDTSNCSYRTQGTAAATHLQLQFPEFTYKRVDPAHLFAICNGCSCSLVYTTKIEDCNTPEILRRSKRALNSSYGLYHRLRMNIYHRSSGHQLIWRSLEASP